MGGNGGWAFIDADSVTGDEPDTALPGRRGPLRPCPDERGPLRPEQRMSGEGAPSWTPPSRACPAGVRPFGVRLPGNNGSEFA
ncbi:hypothetical protein [Actinocorallia sp. A-T 12471]|uniref:hypothetical protein n=1 Tax=Actinocorallia sp. A-T 12471 TaxID=3089813 RepID=UPI0029D0F4E2|nr:hypothetical protein [Actinocorallia sp. A-T 12471]MDX6745045.1 hypothetical protein [Actinocorallia sp. A-T 12471]